MTTIGSRLFQTALTCVICTTATLAFAQGKNAIPPLPKGEFKFLEPSPALRTSPTARGKIEGEVRRVLRGEMQLSDLPAFDTYYLKYYFPLMTLYDAESLNKSIADLRMKFLMRDHIAICIAPEVHAHLADLTLAEMLKISQDNYHPAVRHNAMLIISLLNDQEVVRTGETKMTPDPYARALQPMLDEFAKRDTLDLVRLAALGGIVRHVEWDNYRPDDRKIPAALRAAVLGQLTQLAKEKKAPSFRNDEGHLWMRRKAVEGLGHAVFMKVDTNILKTLEDLMADDKESPVVRATAAAALGRINFATLPKYDVPAAVERLKGVLQAVISAEAERLHHLRLEDDAKVGVVSASTGTQGGTAARGMENLRGPNGLPVVAEDAYYYRVDFSRRKLRSGLANVEAAYKGNDDRPPLRTPRPDVRGLIGLLPAAKPADKALLEKLGKDLDKLAKLAEVETAGLDREGYEDMLKQTAESIVAAGAQPAAAPAAPGDADPAELEGPGQPAAAAPAKAPAAQAQNVDLE